MPNFVFLSLLLLYIVFLPFSGASISSCNGPCQYSSDCVGGLVCIGGKCKDVGTHICTLESDHRNCEPSGSTTLFNGTVCLFYDCSPPLRCSRAARHPPSSSTAIFSTRSRRSATVSYIRRRREWRRCRPGGSTEGRGAGR